MGRIQTLFPVDDEAATNPRPAARDGGGMRWLAVVASFLVAIYPAAIFMGRVFREASIRGLGVMPVGAARPDDYVYQNVQLVLTLIKSLSVSERDLTFWFIGWFVAGVIFVVLLVTLGRLLRHRRHSGKARAWLRKTVSLPSSTTTNVGIAVFALAIFVGGFPFYLAAVAGYGFLMPASLAERAGRLHAKAMWRAVEATDTAAHFSTATLSSAEAAPGPYLVIDCSGECILFDETAKRFVSVRAEQVLRQTGAPKDPQLDALH